MEGKIMSDKEYIVCVDVNFMTPIDVKAGSDDAAAIKAILQFKKEFNKFKKTLNDIANLEIDIDYIECQEFE